jgi:serine/threonine protein kinase
MIRKEISHYRILEELGEGGMGIVYKAHNTKLERDVVIKFLPRHIAANSEERGRFKVEAKVAAALHHQNVATIFAIEEVQDEIYIVLEYIEGQTFRQLTINNDQLSITNLPKVENLREVLNYTIQIAEALQAAHGKGYKSKRASAVFDPSSKRLHVAYTDAKGDVRHR